jgi:large conductance mechanosensitive channel
VKDLLKEYKDFINKGNVVTTAVGLVMALYFKAIIDAIIEGLINPIVAAVVGEESIEGIGFTINGAFFSVGLVINALIIFLIVAVVLFFIVKAYNRSAAAEDAPPTEVDLLVEIRDALRADR